MCRQAIKRALSGIGTDGDGYPKKADSRVWYTCEKESRGRRKVDEDKGSRGRLKQADPRERSQLPWTRMKYNRERVGEHHHSEQNRARADCHVTG